VRIRVQVNREFEAEVNRKVQPDRVEAPARSPHPASIQNRSASDGLYQPNDLLRITGYRLKFRPDRPDEGIFLHLENGPALRVTEYAHVTERQVIFKLPSTIEPGIYRLAVTKRESSGNPITGYYSETIEIQ
jgi:hypothetical protein